MSDTLTPDQQCPKCKGELRPKDHGLHHLHWALDRPICPSCYIATQSERLARGKHREIFDVNQYPTMFKKRMFEELKALAEERNAVKRSLGAEREAAKEAIRAEVRAEEVDAIRRSPFFTRLHLLFNPFGVK